MILLHTSDWHLGESDNNHPYYEDQEFFIEEICRIIEEKNVDGILLAGDTFDRAVSSTDAIKLYDRAMTRLCRGLKKKVFVIAGNHDSAERLENCNDLLSTAGLYISGALTAEQAKVSFGDTEVYLLPWITEEKVKSVYPAEKDKIDSLDAAYRVVTDHMRKTFDPGKKHVVLAHAFITDAETSTSDRTAEIGFATQVSASVFDGFDYVALGHLHKPQDVNETVRYSGTPMPYSFGKEETQEKSVTIIDTATMSREIVPLTLLHKRTSLSGTADELLNTAYDEDIRTGYVKVEVTDRMLDLGLFAELQKKFPNLIDSIGITYNDDDSAIIMTLDELRRIEADPVEVFKRFYQDTFKGEPSEHMLEMFRGCVANVEEKE